MSDLTAIEKRKLECALGTGAPPALRVAGLDFMVDVNSQNKTIVETPGISTYKTAWVCAYQFGKEVF